MTMVRQSTLYFLVLVVQSAAAIQQFDQFIRNPQLDGKMCKVSDLVFQGTSLSDVHCAVQCKANASCLGFMYNPVSTCVGCRGQYADASNLDPETGTQYFAAFDPTTTPAPTSAQTTVAPAPTPAPTTVTPAPTPAPTTVTPAPTPAPTTVTPAPTPAPTTVTPAPTPAPTTVTPAPTPAPTTVTPAPTPAPTTVTPAPTPAPTTVTPAPTPAPTTTPSPTTTESMNNLRLVDGDAANDGRLEVFDTVGGVWMPVRLDTSDWTWKTTQVVCRQLGYNFGGAYHKKNKPFSAGIGGSILWDTIRCTGDEAKIAECPIVRETRYTNNLRDMGVTCYTVEVNKSGFENIRIIDEQANTNARSGKVQILYLNEWRYMCSKALDASVPGIFCKTVSNGAWLHGTGSIKTSSSTTMWGVAMRCFDLTAPHPFFCSNEGWEGEVCNEIVNLDCNDP